MKLKHLEKYLTECLNELAEAYKREKSHQEYSGSDSSIRIDLGGQMRGIATALGAIRGTSAMQETLKALEPYEKKHHA